MDIKVLVSNMLIQHYNSYILLKITPFNQNKINFVTI